MLHLFFSKKIVLVRKEGNLYFHLCSNSKIHALTNNLISFLIEMELCVTNVILVKGRLGNSIHYFAHLLFALLLIFKSNCERIFAHFARFKRLIVSKSLSSLFTKEQRERIALVAL